MEEEEIVEVEVVVLLCHQFLFQKVAKEEAFRKPLISPVTAVLPVCLHAAAVAVATISRV